MQGPQRSPPPGARSGGRRTAFVVTASGKLGTKDCCCASRTSARSRKPEP